jgi:hypothetical protein
MLLFEQRGEFGDVIRLEWGQFRPAQMLGDPLGVRLRLDVLLPFASRMVDNVRFYVSESMMRPRCRSRRARAANGTDRWTSQRGRKRPLIAPRAGPGSRSLFVLSQHGPGAVGAIWWAGLQRLMPMHSAW